MLRVKLSAEALVLVETREDNMQRFRRNPKYLEADNVRSQRSEDRNVQEDGQQNDESTEGSGEEIREEED